MGAPPSVLVLDGSQEIGRLFQVVLSAEGYAVTLSSSRLEFVARLHAAPPDLVLCDPGWRPEDVEAMLALLDAGPKPLGMPLLLCTSADARTLAPPLAARRRPRTELLPKPFDIDDLLAAVQRLCPVTR